MNQDLRRFATSFPLNSVFFKPSFYFLFLIESVFHRRKWCENGTKTSWLVQFIVFTVQQIYYRLVRELALAINNVAFFGMLNISLNDFGFSSGSSRGFIIVSYVYSLIHLIINQIVHQVNLFKKFISNSNSRELKLGPACPFFYCFLDAIASLEMVYWRS